MIDTIIRIEDLLERASSAFALGDQTTALDLSTDADSLAFNLGYVHPHLPNPFDKSNFSLNKFFAQGQSFSGTFLLINDSYNDDFELPSTDFVNSNNEEVAHYLIRQAL